MLLFTHPVVRLVPRCSPTLVAVITLCLAPVPAALAQDGPNDGGEPIALRPGTIAVAPFVNISGQPADEWIGAGIAETVIGGLAQLEAVSVIGPEAFVSLSGTAAETDESERLVRQLGRQLGATWLVTGGYQRLGDQLRITARIIDVESGAVSTRAKIDVAVDDLFMLQDQIVAELTAGNR